MVAVRDVFGTASLAGMEHAMQADGHHEPSSNQSEHSTSVAPTTEFEDLATRAADRSSEMYVSTEQESRSKRFDRAVQQGRSE